LLISAFLGQGKGLDGVGATHPDGYCSFFEIVEIFTIVGIREIFEIREIAGIEAGVVTLTALQGVRKQQRYSNLHPRFHQVLAGN